MREALRYSDSSARLGQEPAAIDLEIATEHDVDSFGIANMLLFENARGEGLFVIVRQDRYSPLRDGRSMIKLFIHKMDGAAGNFSAVFDGLSRAVKTSKGRQE